jgi:hypothetical protein
MDNTPFIPALTKIFFGLIYKDSKGLEFATRKISQLGKIDVQSIEIPFDFTNYYKDEMGDILKRKWLAIDKIIPENDLADLKQKAVNWEKELTFEGKRTLNCDPGGICDNRVVLVTTKNFSHRIYIGKGIFAEVTLIYIGDKFQPQKWTYPDYKSDIFQDFAKKCKKKFLEKKLQDYPTTHQN